MTTVDVLRTAQTLYANNPDHGQRLPKPGTYCIVTACSTAAGDPTGIAYLAALDALRRIAGPYLARWNIDHTTAEVLALFDTAIENELAREAEFNITRELVAA